MLVYIFKTNIPTQEKAMALDPLFEKHKSIQQWTIDTEDIDNVLRIETADRLSENAFIRGVQQAGYACEVLSY